MKRPIWIKSEYVTYIGIALLSFESKGYKPGGLAPPKLGGETAFYVFWLSCI